jgi:hypothetical protein
VSLGVTGDHCHVPILKKEVGSWFDGVSSTIKLSNIVMNSTFSSRLWVRSSITNVSLLSFETNWLDVKQAYREYEVICKPASKQDIRPDRLTLDLWISNCNSLVLDLSENLHLESTHGAVTNDLWTEIIISVSSNIESEPLHRANFSTTLEMSINGQTVGSAELGSLTIWLDEDTHLYLGSYLGYLYFL